MQQRSFLIIKTNPSVHDHVLLQIIINLSHHFLIRILLLLLRQNTHALYLIDVVSK